jgi:hypothetical protein
LTKEEIQKRAEALKREEEQRVLSTLKKRGYRYAPLRERRLPLRERGRKSALKPSRDSASANRLKSSLKRERKQALKRESKGR